MRYLKQSTASQVRTIGPFLDDTDFKTAETGLTIANTDIRLKKNGADDVAKNSGGGTHDVNGCYHLTFDATDTDTVGELFYTVKVAGALQVFGSFTVLEEAVYDMLFGASAVGYISNAPVNVAQFGGSNGTFSGGRPEVNTSHAGGTAWNSGAIGASTLASDTIAAAKIANGAITAAKFAAGAIDAAATSADFVTELATGIWQDATSSDFTAANSIGKCLYINNVAPGGSGGHMISGSNSGTTTLAALTVTGALTVSDGVAISRSTPDGDGVRIDGNGTGIGLKIQSGSGSTGTAVYIASAATNGTGLLIGGAGTGSGLVLNGGATGIGLDIAGGGTSGDAVEITTTSGHGINIAATGTSKHGLLITGGNGGTSDGVSLVAGTGGVGLRAGSLTVTGTTTLAALTTTGTATLNALTVSNATTLTGAVSATSASNDIRGIALHATQAAYAPATAAALASLVTTVGVAGAGLTDLGGMSTTMKAQVEQEALDALQQTVPDTVPADGSRPNVQQAVRMILQALIEGGISGTTWTVKKEDGSTTLLTVTLDSATTPTSKTRAT